MKILHTGHWHIRQLFNECERIDLEYSINRSGTLNISMDALGRLHNQGRKVDVISHVQEMTEVYRFRLTRVSSKVGRVWWRYKFIIFTIII